ncbi:PREDICTED: transcription cofactor HES-6-like [Cyprinodon variegatus]|uniref:Hairy-related 8.2 n=1 Tax=Cyprinodon variegatus TaxID=28743 RepID=A0A3Q2CIM6_CYPVA|nr:PREDICTED: transcription cofactor HES-6-like [Cyprinodon variegatus]
MTASTAAQNVDRHPRAKEERKLRKPLIERKRRERINNCLDQLKEAVIGAFGLDQSKLEKADILEMTVKHLQNIQNIKLNDSALGLEAQQKYSTGYIQCMHEVHNLLLSCDWMDKTLGSRLLNHLLKSLPRSSSDLSRPTQRHDAQPWSSPGVPATPPHRDPVVVRQHQKEEPAGQVPECQERPAVHSSSLMMLEMWRPW